MAMAVEESMVAMQVEAEEVGLVAVVELWTCVISDAGVVAAGVVVAVVVT